MGLLQEQGMRGGASPKISARGGKQEQWEQPWVVGVEHF